MRNIGKGEEIFSTYLDAGLELPLRQATLQSCWGFKCRCELCRLDAHDDHVNRQSLDDSQAREHACAAGSVELLKLKDVLERRYTAERSVRPALALVLRDLAGQEDSSLKERFAVCDPISIAKLLDIPRPSLMSSTSSKAWSPAESLSRRLPI